MRNRTVPSFLADMFPVGDGPVRTESALFESVGTFDSPDALGATDVLGGDDHRAVLHLEDPVPALAITSSRSIR